MKEDIGAAEGCQARTLQQPLQPSLSVWRIARPKKITKERIIRCGSADENGRRDYYVNYFRLVWWVLMDEVTKKTTRGKHTVE